jgi:hypothetical protein
MINDQLSWSVCVWERGKVYFLSVERLVLLHTIPIPIPHLHEKLWLRLWSWARWFVGLDGCKNLSVRLSLCHWKMQQRARNWENSGGRHYYHHLHRYGHGNGKWELGIGETGWVWGRAGIGKWRFIPMFITCLQCSVVCSVVWNSVLDFESSVSCCVCVGDVMCSVGEVLR